GLGGATKEFVHLNYTSLTVKYLDTDAYPTQNFHPTSCYSSSCSALKAILLPGTNNGYWFGDTSTDPSYSPFAQIRRVLRYAQMSITGGSLTVQGTISPGTNLLTEEHYNYPATWSASALPSFIDYDTQDSKVYYKDPYSGVWGLERTTTV